MPLNARQRLCLISAWVISIVAMLSTLWAGEVMLLPICNLCWYQRICLYPLVLILGIACYRDDNAIVPYILALPIVSALFAAYQYLEQMFPSFGRINLCGAGPACTDVTFKLFGFITFPLMSFGASIVIFVLLWWAKSSGK